MENQNQTKALIAVTPTRQCIAQSRGSEDSRIIHSLNLKLQLKVNNLENEVGRLNEEIEKYKGKNLLYESLTKDLASFRTQLDKTTLALLKKCDAYDELKKELTDLKRQYNISPKSSLERSKKHFGSKGMVASSSKRKLTIYHEIMNMSVSDDEPSTSKTGRPSIGSCGNILKEITDEEFMPSCLKPYAASQAPLRKRVLMKAHTLRSASTESLESIGRKSFTANEGNAKSNAKVSAEVPPKKTKPTLDTSLQSRKGKPNLNTSVQCLKPSSQKGSSSGRSANLNSSHQCLKVSSAKVPPSTRPALGQTNGRVVQINTSIKKSNSSCSGKSVSTRPAFRF